MLCGAALQAAWCLGLLSATAADLSVRRLPSDALAEGAAEHGSEGAAAELCRALRRVVSEGEVFCGADLGNSSVHAFNPQCGQIPPAIVVRPACADEVQAVVKVTLQHRWPWFSVRGGGHSYVCNSFVRKDSLHLDMSAMRDSNFTEGETHGYARLGPGLLLQDLPSIIPDTYQYAIGTCPTVGIVGFLIHGGSSPRTKWLGNTTIYSMDVVTADGQLLTLSDESPHSDLWYAMRMAGSSFAVVTSLTLKLERKPQRGFLFVPTNNSFEELLASLEPPSSDNDTWKGIFRFDHIYPQLGGKWMLKLSPPQSVTAQDVALIRGAAASGDDSAASRQLPWLRDVLSWAQRQKVRMDLAAASTEPEDARGKLGAASLSSRGGGAPGAPAWSSYPSRLRWAAEGHTGEFGITDMGSTGRFLQRDWYKEIASLLHGFFKDHASTSWFDLGPIKSSSDAVFSDLSAFTVETTHALREFVDENAGLLDTHGSRYYNLPLWGTPHKLYWPNYDELSAIKGKWDPADFFYITDGIHPPSSPTSDQYGD